MIPPNEVRHFVHKKIGRFARRFGGAIPVIGGAVQAIGTALAGSPGGKIVQAFTPTVSPRGISRTTVLPAPRLVQQVGVAPPAPPGAVTSPALHGTTGSFQAVTGAFGLPAMAPLVETRQHLVCAKGMVLGEDNLCYPRQILRRNSRFRKWRGAPRPPISAADVKMFRRLKGARETLKEFGAIVDLKVTKK